ncbi:hypothetical protein E4T50_12207 [Aureobasidium sp. EXF-12298]|nr:hypothetical protein E4T50_12207 [Aureobasidium sp. EXF-12298]KAI4751829.1 hypothetical protein E4T51_14969 [Aureobasidium sp. EXF-12344]KAI4772010.1 hypothetical protein E4T52_13000 [Aureobasidium sp. EXF-3400]
MPTILVSGAASGLGRAFLEAYSHEETNTVIAIDREQIHLAAYQNRAATVTSHIVDVTDEKTINDLATALKGTPIDLFVHSVGIRGTFLLIRSLLPNLRRANAAKVVVMSSRMGSLGYNTTGSAYAYRASKAALNAIIKSLSIDVPEVVFVLCHPGRVESRLVKYKEEGAISAEESVLGLLPLVQAWDKNNSGQFYDRFGQPIVW